MSGQGRPPRPQRGLFRRGGASRQAPAGGLRVHAEFESGNVERINAVSAAHVRFAARAGASPRPLWFYFCLEDARVPAVRCDLANADLCLGPREGWSTTRPVFSPDGQTWERVSRAAYVEDGVGSGYFTFTVPVVGLKTYVAYSYPYTTADLAALLQTLPDRQGLQQAELCRSAENRPVPYLRLGNHETPRQSVWIIARQHAGETPASFVVEGMVQWMARLDPRVMQALSHTAFHVVPMVDVDGVFHGRYGKDEQPVDFNRDWRDPPVRPEIRALVKAIRASNARHPVDGVLDVHASHHGDTSCYMFGAPQPEGKDGEDGEDAFERQGRLVRCLAGEAPPDIGFRETDLRAEPPPARSARQYLSELLRAPVLTMEMSYHLAQSGETLTPRHYRDFGAALARALHRSLHADSV